MAVFPKVMTLPLKALGLLLRSAKLIFLTFFPGALTFITSVTITYYTWLHFLGPYSWWVEIPGTLVVFFLTWLIVGNLSLIPVEDWIIDEVQRAHSGRIVIPSPPFSTNRIIRELGFSLLIAGAALSLFFISLIPGSWPITFACASWLTAYGFLATLYSRSTHTVKERLRLFSRNWFQNLILGAFLNILLFIPVLNVFLLGYALILSTLVFIERSER